MGADDTRNIDLRVQDFLHPYQICVGALAVLDEEEAVSFRNMELSEKSVGALARTCSAVAACFLAILEIPVARLQVQSWRDNTLEYRQGTGQAAFDVYPASPSVADGKQ